MPTFRESFREFEAPGCDFETLCDVGALRLPKLNQVTVFMRGILVGIST